MKAAMLLLLRRTCFHPPFSITRTRTLTLTRNKTLPFPLLTALFTTTNPTSSSVTNVAVTYEDNSKPYTRSRTKAMRKARRKSPEGMLKQELDMCSKRGDLETAIRLYDEARKNGVCLNLYHYNAMLYLFSLRGSSSSSVEKKIKGGFDVDLRRGFEIFQELFVDKVLPNESTFTSAARLAASLDDPHMAFDLLKRMKSFNISPKLRSFSTVIFGFCKQGILDKAYEVDALMSQSGLVPEEPELTALLKLSTDHNKAEKVYEILHRLRATVRQVSEDTAAIVEDWFNSKQAAKVGKDGWDVMKIRKEIERRGGGWHGQGWLGTGKWRVARTHMDENGVCQCCGEQLVSIDIDPSETENFATSLSNLACKRVKDNFVQFQEWIKQHGPFGAVVDGANVGLSHGREDFSFYHLNTVVNKLRHMNPSRKYPLVILHTSRVQGGPALDPYNKKLLQRWKTSGSLYVTPHGSNDDWYWLYAAVSCKCLVMTNDEMRDHLFQLLGTSFFPRWKEKHQVRLSSSANELRFFMPPPYSIVIQESENGSWHVPTMSGDDLEHPRVWLCATRSKQS